MKKYIIAMIAMFYSFIYAGTLFAAGNAWTAKTDFGGTARYAAVGFSIGAKGYIGTGLDATSYTTDFWEYDPAGAGGAGTWTQKANFGGAARSDAVGFSIGTKGYIGTGWNGTAYTKDFWEYDQTGNAWAQRADFGGVARGNAVGFSIGTKGYIGTGYDGSSYYKDLWEFDPAGGVGGAGAWTAKTDFPGTARYSAVGFSIGGTKGYIGTGWDGTDYTIDFWEYDPAGAGAWTAKTNFGGTARYSAVGFSIGGKGYIGTGWDGSSRNDFWEYDQAGNTWVQRADFGGVERVGAVGFSIGSEGYLGTGDDGVSLKKDFQEYSPNTTPDFGGTARANAVGFSITTGAGTKGYIGTGWNGTSYYNDFWEYDPAGAGTWTQLVAAPFGGTARYGAVGFSIGAKGYIGTGYNGTAYTKDFWEYDPGTNLWAQRADFGGAARGYAVGFSIGAKGYIGTGYNNAYLKDFWEFDPAGGVGGAGAWTAKTDFGGIARSDAVGFSITTGAGTKGYIGTGWDGTSYKKDFYEYDQTGNTWTAKTDFGGIARFAAVGFSIGTKGYIGTGYSDVYLKDIWEYDPTGAGIWTQKSDFGGTARYAAVGFSIGAKGYIGTGYNDAYLKDFWEFNPTDGILNPFIFIDQTGVPLNTVITSNTIAVSGIIDPAAISITGGTYSINGALPYTSAVGTVSNGSTVTVRVTSSGSYLTTTNATLTIGPLSDTFSVTTQDALCDTTPNAFAFTDQTNVGLSQTISSNTITVSGITCEAPISITGGAYSINGGLVYTDVVGTVNNGDTVTLRQTSSGSSSTTTDTTLAIGGISDVFSVTTCDVVPAPFVFTDQTGAVLNQTITSNTITVSGIVCASSISITGGTYSINGGAYTSAVGTVSNGNTVTVRQTSSGSYSTTTNATLTIGGVSDTFSVTTIGPTEPVIQVAPGALNFGAVPTGTGKELTLTVRNIGSGTLTGNATTSAPFSIVSGGSYSLGFDQSQVVTIRYEPTTPGRHIGMVGFTGGTGASIRVTGNISLPWLMLLLGD